MFGKLKADESPGSFIFTLTNLHDLPPQKFELKGDRRSVAIRVSSRLDPCFGNGDDDGDLVISDQCTMNANRSRGFGSTYENTTRVDGCVLLTCYETFLVDEIKVFQIPLFVDV
jgi:hypothetical protein